MKSLSVKLLAAGLICGGYAVITKEVNPVRLSAICGATLLLILVTTFWKVRRFDPKTRHRRVSKESPYAVRAGLVGAAIGLLALVLVQGGGHALTTIPAID